MMSSALIEGNLVEDPRELAGRNGKGVGFRMASNKSFKKEDGTWGETAMFINVVMWPGSTRQSTEMIEGALANLTKGAKVIVSGELYQRDYQTKDTPPQKRTSTELRATSVGLVISNVASYVRTPTRSSASSDGGDKVPF